jgi:glycosyltransferase involved in cell wall biosynthesis
MAAKLRISIHGTRGIPANYGGFETFAQELSVRLAARGHDVAVYGRNHYVSPEIAEFQGVVVRRLPAIQSKYLETVSHTLLSILDSLRRGDRILLVCNAVNAGFCWIPRVLGRKVVLNVDGIERKRKKWSAAGRGVYWISERMAVRFPHVAVTDAAVIQDYYRRRLGAETRMIAYGAEAAGEESQDCLVRLGLRPVEYFLYVSRLEPENNAHLVMMAYLASGAHIPLVVVGDAPYSKRYQEKLKRLAVRGDIRMPGAIYGQGYRELLSHCSAYLQATEVGGTHPALLEAMGCGALVIAHDSPENRETLADCGLLRSFHETESLAALLLQVEQNRQKWDHLPRLAQERIKAFYSWDRIVDRYERLFEELGGG